MTHRLPFRCFTRKWRTTSARSCAGCSARTLTSTGRRSCAAPRSQPAARAWRTAVPTTVGPAVPWLLFSCSSSSSNSTTTITTKRTITTIITTSSSSIIIINCNQEEAGADFVIASETGASARRVPWAIIAATWGGTRAPKITLSIQLWTTRLQPPSVF